MKRKLNTSPTPSPLSPTLHTGCSGHIGRRSAMEDAHINLSDMDIKHMYPTVPPACRLAIYGILDGHGGAEVAKQASQLLPDKIIQNMQKNGKFKTTSKYVLRALEIAFKETEEAVLQSSHGTHQGCCVVLALIVNDVTYIANLGDSKAVLCRRLKSSATDEDMRTKDVIGTEDVSGSSVRNRLSVHSFPWTRGEISPPPAAECVPLTVDHDPDVPDERTRVVAAGGRVEAGRVYGPSDKNGMSHSIGVARTLGDGYMKKFGVSSEPDLRIRFSIVPPPKDNGDNGSVVDNPYPEFLLLACDGLWARYSPATALSFVRNRLYAGTTWSNGVEHKWSLDSICKGLVEDAVYEKGCQDNVSVMVIQFIHEEMSNPPRIY